MAVAVFGSVRYRSAEIIPSWLVTTALVLALICGGLMSWTGSLGGQIRHTEVRPGFVAAKH